MNLWRGLHYDRYPIAGQQEFVLRIGRSDAIPLLVLPPLFEELNRTRALLAGLMRQLAGSGFGCWLPELPGTGESERALQDIAWANWRAAAAAAADHVAQASGRRPLILSCRGGTLLDSACEGHAFWRFAPAEGASLARDMVRSSLVGDRETGGDVLDLAGYPVPRALLKELEGATPEPVSPLRTVRLTTDRGEADVKVEGPALWRRSEPGTSPELGRTLSADVTAWAKQCGVC